MLTTPTPKSIKLPLIVSFYNNCSSILGWFVAVPDLNRIWLDLGHKVKKWNLDHELGIRIRLLFIFPKNCSDHFFIQWKIDIKSGIVTLRNLKKPFP